MCKYLSIFHLFLFKMAARKICHLFNSKRVVHAGFQYGGRWIESSVLETRLEFASMKCTRVYIFSNLQKFELV